MNLDPLKKFVELDQYSLSRLPNIKNIGRVATVLSVDNEDALKRAMLDNGYAHRNARCKYCLVVYKI